LKATEANKDNPHSFTKPHGMFLKVPFITLQFNWQFETSNYVGLSSFKIFLSLSAKIMGHKVA
jgi:hypothetical protein